jgi:hypothetical protein
VQDELQRLGLGAEILSFYATGSRYWGFRLRSGGRVFVAGVNHRGLFCWDISDGNERNLIPPAVGPVFGDPFQLGRAAVRLVRHASQHPEFACGEPQVV